MSLLITGTGSSGTGAAESALVPDTESVLVQTSEPGLAPDSVHFVVDIVDLPAGVVSGPAASWSIEFNEEWEIMPGRPGIRKSVNGISLHCSMDRELTQDSLRALMSSSLANLPGVKGKIRLKNISYEFTLLDPHTPGSENLDIDGLDGMDLGTRQLQQDLISLVRGRSPALIRHLSALRGRDGSETMGEPELEEILYSFQFHETWLIDPATLQFSKEVKGITPVIWQRRRSVTSEPVNDAETGLPVYYKNQLDRIELRNP